MIDINAIITQALTAAVAEATKPLIERITTLETKLAEAALFERTTEVTIPVDEALDVVLVTVRAVLLVVVDAPLDQAVDVVLVEVVGVLQMRVEGLLHHLLNPLVGCGGDLVQPVLGITQPLLDVVQLIDGDVAVVGDVPGDLLPEPLLRVEGLGHLGLVQKLLRNASIDISI